MSLRLVSIQSHVVFGHVGNSAAVFPLQRLGTEVWPIHTVQYSSHAGYPGFRGEVFDADLIDDCVAGIGALGQLERCHGLLSGYAGSLAIGQAILRAAQSLRNANAAAFYCCDPVLGDFGRGVYAAAGLVEFIGGALLPAATILTPNGFELALLSGVQIRDALSARQAMAILHKRGPRIIVATSLALDDTPKDAIDMIVSEGAGLWRLRTPRAPIAVNGAGDLFAALFFHHWLTTPSAPEALARAAASVYGVIAATARSGGREIALIAAQEEFVAPTHNFAPQPF